VAKPSVLILTSTFPRWANDTEPPFVFELCRRLVPYYDLHVLAPHCPGSPTSETMDGIHVHRFRYGFAGWENLAYEGGILPRLRRHPLLFSLIPFFLVGQLVAALRLLRRYRIRAIHAHWILPQGLIALVTRRVGDSSVGIVCTLHGADLYGLKGKLFGRIRRIVVKRADRVTVVSHAMKNDLIPNAADSHKVSVIPMGVDLRQRFTPGAIPGAGNSLLFVGRLVEKKGLRYLLEAMPTILHGCPSANLRVVGTGPEKPTFERMALQLNIDHRVRFMGAVPNQGLPQLYRSAGILVFPSVIASDGDQEGFGLVLVEAMGCGCTVLASDLQPMRDIVVPWKTGGVFAPADPEQLAEAVLRLISDDHLRSRLARNGRIFAVERFDWDLIVRRYRELLDAAGNA
jgi:glycosyltransferase involved in cell wall biosynthesis